MMGDLAAFLTARLDEEYAAAKASYDEAVDYRIVGGRYTEDHFALWKPARVLAEVEAKREIIECCNEHDLPRASQGSTWGSYVLRRLALPYADHPDYDEALKP